MMSFPGCLLGFKQTARCPCRTFWSAQVGVIDQGQTPAWRGDQPPPVAIDRVQAVVIDGTWTPWRLGALPEDIAMGRANS
jgi:hypothetical protein